MFKVHTHTHTRTKKAAARARVSGSPHVPDGREGDPSPSSKENTYSVHATHHAAEKDVEGW